MPKRYGWNPSTQPSVSPPNQTRTVGPIGKLINVSELTIYDDQGQPLFSTQFAPVLAHPGDTINFQITMQV